jgi:hypothetical protein
MEIFIGAYMNNKPDTCIFIYQINSEDKIVFINEEWIEFEKENSAEKLTHDISMGLINGSLLQT